MAGEPSGIAFDGSSSCRLSVSAWLAGARNREGGNRAMSCLASRCDRMILEVICDLNCGGVHGVLPRIPGDDEHVDLRPDGDVPGREQVHAASQHKGRIREDRARAGGHAIPVERGYRLPWSVERGPIESEPCLDERADSTIPPALPS